MQNLSLGFCPKYVCNKSSSLLINCTARRKKNPLCQTIPNRRKKTGIGVSPAGDEESLLQIQPLGTVQLERRIERVWPFVVRLAQFIIPSKQQILLLLFLQGSKCRMHSAFSILLSKFSMAFGAQRSRDAVKRRR